MQNRRGDDVVEQSMPLSGAGDETRRQEAAAQGLESSVSSGDVAMRIFNSDCVMALRNTCPSSARELLQRPTSCDPLHVGYEVVHQMEELMVGAVSNATSVSYTVCGASLLVWHTATNLAVMRDLLSRVFFAHDRYWGKEKERSTSLLAPSKSLSLSLSYIHTPSSPLSLSRSPSSACG